MKEISLGNGLVSLVDDEDYDLLSQYDWRAQPTKRPGVFYATRSVKVQKGKPFNTVYMHRELLNAPKGVLVDHRNHQTLDNQRHNIRLATHKDNAANSLREVGVSGYRGVRYCKRDDAYVVQVKSDSGYFKSALIAASAYDGWARKHFGEFAVLNFPSRGEAKQSA